MGDDVKSNVSVPVGHMRCSGLKQVYHFLLPSPRERDGRLQKTVDSERNESLLDPKLGGKLLFWHTRSRNPAGQKGLRPEKQHAFHSAREITLLKKEADLAQIMYKSAERE